jgi:hypothetical protein
LADQCQPILGAIFDIAVDFEFPIGRGFDQPPVRVVGVARIRESRRDDKLALTFRKKQSAGDPANTAITTKIIIMPLDTESLDAWRGDAR